MTLPDPLAPVSPFVAYDPWVLAAAALIMLVGGTVKGAVGFALPMIAVAGIGSFLDAQSTIALIILPIFVTNLWQTLRQGLGPAVATGRRFWKLIVIMAVLIGAIAQVLPDIPSDAIFLALGVVVALSASLQLAGWRPRAPEGRGARLALEVLVGIVAGICGGLAGVWGPPILFFLLALDTPKTDQVRAQGLSFFVGSCVLLVAHLRSGLLDGASLPASALLVAPVAVGMAIGVRLQDRMDQGVFRRITLVVLCLAGLNLLRRGLS